MRAKSTVFTRKSALLTVFLFVLLLVALIMIKSTLYLHRYNMSESTGRIEYLATLGWQVSEAQCEAMEICFPESFGDIMLSYNQLQVQNGFDLSKYAGKRCIQYTYTALNGAENSSKIYIVMYVRGKKLIGGDIHTADLGGSMYPLTAKSVLE